MQTSRKGKITLIVTEGIVDTYYLDSATPPVPTFGIGHTKSAGEPDPLIYRGKRAQLSTIFELFEKDLKTYEAIVNRHVKVPLSQPQFDALVHFVYNIGEPNFKRSRLLKNLNEKQYMLAGQRGFHGWLKPPALRKRRDKERKIFLEGNYGSTIAPLYTADINGKTERIGSIELEGVYPKESNSSNANEDQQEVTEMATNDTVRAEVKSSWLSKINWTQAVSFAASMLIVFGVDLAPETQVEIVAGIQGVQAALTWIMRTWFTTSMTKASA